MGVASYEYHRFAAIIDLHHLIAINKLDGGCKNIIHARSRIIMQNGIKIMESYEYSYKWQP